jgi:hypothetical protein
VFLFCSMNATPTQDLTDRFPASFEEFRDLWATEETREGLIGRMQRVIMRLLNTLVVMLAEAREHRLAEAEAGDPAADVCVADAGSCDDDAESTPRRTRRADLKCAGGKKPARAVRAARIARADAIRLAIGGAGREVGQRRGGTTTPCPEAVVARPSPARFAARFHRDRRKRLFAKNRVPGGRVIVLFSLRYRNYFARLNPTGRTMSST